MNGVDWLAQRIMATANADMATSSEEALRFNPRPPGVIRDGSATQAVLLHLQRYPGRYFHRAQIVTATARTERAVDWALIFLRAQRRIQVVEDIQRNPRYFRYGIAKDGEA